MSRVLAVRVTRAGMALLCLFGLAACSSSKSKSTSNTPKSDVSWPAPADPLARTRAAGLEPEPAEQLAHHVHSHLDVFVNGEQVTVPAGIGINIKDPAVKTLNIDGQTGYGGISPPCKQPCISPLHTHLPTGILHTESATDVDNTLGEFFTEWDVKLDDKCVATYCAPTDKIAVYVDGKPVTSDPREIALTDHKEIAIVIGTPPATVPDSGDFSTD